LVANSNNWNVFVYVLTKIFLFFFPFFRFPIPKRPLTLFFFLRSTSKIPTQERLSVCHIYVLLFLIYGNESKMSQTRQPFSFLSTLSHSKPHPCSPSPLIEKQKMLFSMYIYLISLTIRTVGRLLVEQNKKVVLETIYVRWSLQF
jgi:hypothetical protein